MESVSLIAIIDGVVDSNRLFVGPKDRITEAVEKAFLSACAENIWNFADYTREDLDAITEDGYAQWGDGNSVCISWPDVIDITYGVGDEVTWNDPDGGICSHTGIIAEITPSNAGDGAFLIRMQDGWCSEVLGKELS